MGGRDKLDEYVGSAIPMARFGTVNEIADGIVYLASDQSSFMTGHALVIDGGESIWETAPMVEQADHAACHIFTGISLCGQNSGVVRYNLMSCEVLEPWIVQIEQHVWQKGII